MLDPWLKYSTNSEMATTELPRDTWIETDKESKTMFTSKNSDKFLQNK
jgi:hypothetical protein